MTRSIGLSLLRGLQRIGDHVAKQLVKKLRGAEMHTQTRTDNGDGLVVGVRGASGKGQADYPVSLRGLSDQVHVLDFNALVANEQTIGAYRQCSLSHQKLPIGTVFDASKLNAKALGVDSSRGEK